MRSPRDTYVSARWRAFHASVALYFRLRMRASMLFSILRKGSEFGFSRPDEMVRVRWHGHAEPTSWLKGGQAPGGCEELKRTQRMLLRSC